jgi:hypothetical protein
MISQVLPMGLEAAFLLPDNDLLPESIVSDFVMCFRFMINSILFVLMHLYRYIYHFHYVSYMIYIFFCIVVYYFIFYLLMSLIFIS